MEVKEVIQMAFDSRLISLIVGGAASLLYLSGYLIIYKKMMHGKRSIRLVQGVSVFFLFLYVGLVYAATLWTRGAYYQHSVNLSFLSTYRVAWNSYSARAWRFIILNIMMFIPIGFLLPLSFPACKKFWLTYVIGAVLTAIIEGTQYVSSQGIFEVADLIHNAAGCMIGYGFWQIVHSIYRKIRKKESGEHLLRWVICSQIPLLAVCSVFGLIVTAYHMKELGNLEINYRTIKNMSKIKLSSEIDFSEQAGEEPVYKAQTGTKEDIRKIAQQIFSVVHEKVDTKKIQFWEKGADYYSEDGTYRCTVTYVGLKTSFVTFGMDKEENAETAFSMEEMKDLIKPYGIELPDSAQIEQVSNNSYILRVDMVKENDYYVDGSLSLSVNQDGEVYRFDNQLVQYWPYGNFSALSEKDAYNKLNQGKFNYYSPYKVKEITVTGIRKFYGMDTKAFYQPIYEFKVKTDKDEGVIYLPALR